MACLPWCPLSGLMLCPYEELNECLFLRSELIALDDMVGLFPQVASESCHFLLLPVSSLVLFLTLISGRGINVHQSDF